MLSLAPLMQLILGMFGLKAGGTYMIESGVANQNQQIFVESGGEVVAGGLGIYNIYYLKEGSSFKAQEDDNLSMR